MNYGNNISTICLLVNPLTFEKKGKKLVPQIRHELQQRAIPFHIHVNQWPERLEGYSDVWIVGGDGTLNFVLNKYHKIHQPIVLFKGGTGNDFHRQLYGKISLSRQIEKVLTSPPGNIDVGKCNGQYYLNSAGFGFDGEVLKSIKTIRSVGGHLGYLWIVLKKVFTFRELYFEIKTEKADFSGKFLLVAVNNSVSTGGGFNVTPKASPEDGLLDLMLCKPLPVIKRLAYLPKIEKGKHLHLPFITYSQERYVNIKTNGKIVAQLDGELISGSEFQLEVLPGYIRFRF